MPALLWFRRDLRLHDHPALAAAARNGEQVLACFVLDPRLEASSGRRRLQFLGDSLRRLRDDLDGRLLVARGRPERWIPHIAKEIGASAVHVSEDFAPYGRRRDERVRAALDSVPLVATGSPYLVSPGRVTKKDGSTYQVFTPFLRRWREVGWRAPAKSSVRAARSYFRVFNATTQGEKFDPSGDYIRRWVPELRAAQDAHLRTERPHGYPAPIVDHGAERAEALRRYRSI